LVNCPSCKSRSLEKIKSWEYPLKNTGIVYEVTYYRCKKCGQRFFYYKKIKGEKGKRSFYVLVPPKKKE